MSDCRAARDDALEPTIRDDTHCKAIMAAQEEQIILASQQLHDQIGLAQVRFA